MARKDAERRFHDLEAVSRALTFDREPDRLRFSDDEYLDHASWVRPAFERLGDVRGRRVLDLGCGHGMAATVLARRGARVTACDLSPGYVAEARRRAAANEVEVAFAAADAERLPLADGAFDAVWGHAILHHLDVATAGVELRRVLRPGGVAVLCEPWAGNPLLTAVRRFRRHTEDERPLRAADVQRLEGVFSRVHVTPFELTGLSTVDRWAMCWAPARRWCRYVVVALH
jgi:SAM-dependent methyltransferase